MRLVQVSEYKIVDASIGNVWEYTEDTLEANPESGLPSSVDLNGKFLVCDDEADVLWAWLLSNVEG